MNTASIQPADLLNQWTAGHAFDLIDVRTPAEFGELHVEFARNVPLDQLDSHVISQIAKNRTVYIVCRSGARGQRACQRLLKAGLDNAVNVEGGTLACQQAGLPIVRGKQAISLERQVRIAAGSLVLLGVLLGWLIHPAFVALSAFVGAGLVFAGITDTCGLGLLLARLPWNRRGQSSTSCGAH